MALPTAQGKRTDIETSSEQTDEVKTKTETARTMGYSHNEVHDYQQMAKHPEVVQAVIDNALASSLPRS